MIEKFILGTYTRGESQGIYTIDLDKETDRLENLSLKAETASPTYLDVSFDLSKVYSIGGEGDETGIASYQVDEDGNFELVDQSFKLEVAPCYIRLDEKKNLVYTANYHEGDVRTYQTNGQLKLSQIDLVEHEGSSVHENQDNPHAHYFDLTPDEDYLIACDLGTDEIITYRTDDSGNIEHVSTFTTPAGFGPRHIAFHPNAEYVYAFGELSNEILVLHYDHQTGSLSELEKVSTLPEDFKEESSGAAIRVSHDGKHLYASNRGHNSIVHYQIGDDGQLQVMDWYPTHGDGPRDFNFSVNQDYLLIGHQYSDNLTLYRRDDVTGKLDLVEQGVYAPEVVCIKNFDRNF